MKQTESDAVGQGLVFLYTPDPLEQEIEDASKASRPQSQLMLKRLEAALRFRGEESFAER